MWSSGLIAAMVVVFAIAIVGLVLGSIAIARLCCYVEKRSMQGMLNFSGITQAVTTDQSVPAGTISTLLFGSTVNQTGEGISYDSTTGIFKVSRQGWYGGAFVVSLTPPTMTFPAPSGTEVQVFLSKNSVDSVPYAEAQVGATSSAAVPQIASAADYLYLNCGDTVEVRLNNTATTAVSTIATVSHVSLVYQGNGRCPPPPCPPPCTTGPSCSESC